MTVKNLKSWHLALLLVLPLLTGCNALVQPDLTRLYQQSRESRQPPVILIHGLMGSRLADRKSGKEVWVGNLAKLTFSHYEDISLRIDPKTLMNKPSRLVATGLLDRVVGRDFYAGITETLEAAGGYRLATPGTPQTGKQRNYYVFVYDWRQDMVQTAQKLTRYIEQIRRDYRQPDLKVDLVAHSMGGLIARYYLRYGDKDVLDKNTYDVNFEGAKHVRRIILLGTPNLGSATALYSFIGGFQFGIRRIPPEVMLTMPSAYQMFPHQLNHWIIDASGKALNDDLYDVDTWRRYHWSVFDPGVRADVMRRYADRQAGKAYLDLLQRFFAKQLERARRFTWALTVPLPSQPYKLIVMGGDCKLTPARFVLEKINGHAEIRLWPWQIRHPVANVDYSHLMLEPGDGKVTKASLLARESLDPSVPRHSWISFPLDYPIFLCEVHESLTGNSHFQDNLLHALLSLDRNY